MIMLDSISYMIYEQTFNMLHKDGENVMWYYHHHPHNPLSYVVITCDVAMYTYVLILLSQQNTFAYICKYSFHEHTISFHVSFLSFFIDSHIQSCFSYTKNDIWNVCLSDLHHRNIQTKNVFLVCHRLSPYIHSLCRDKVCCTYAWHVYMCVANANNITLFTSPTSSSSSCCTLHHKHCCEFPILQLRNAQERALPWLNTSSLKSLSLASWFRATNSHCFQHGIHTNPFKLCHSFRPRNYGE